MSIPNNPVILLSYLNMKLRDEYPSLEEFCKSNMVDPEEIIEKMTVINYSYDEKNNQFI